VQGVDGKKVGASGDVNRVCRMFCTPGMIGAALSHVECWQRVVDRNLDHALILEDDAVVVDTFEDEMQIALKSVPSSYHVLLLGCFTCSPLVQKLVSGFSGADSQTRNGIRTISYFNGTHAYIVSREGAKFLLEATQKKASYHIDFHMSTIRGLKVYAVSDDIAFQEDMSTSSIAATSSGASFPGTINSLLSMVKTSKNVSWAYMANVPAMQLGPVVVTLWTLIFFWLGLSQKIPLMWLILCSLIDMLIVPSALGDIATKIALFAIGNNMNILFHR